MKKVFHILFVSIILFSCCACENTKEEEIIKTTDKEEKIEIIDNNPIEIGLYTRDSGGYHLIKDEIYLPWNKYIDIAVFKVLPTIEENVKGWYMQDVFPEYWNKYDNINNYKIGFTLKYTTDQGETSWNIIKPSDRMQYVFNYVQLYVYDDVTPAKGVWYDHLDDDEVTYNVLFTSIKLCASTYIDEIVGPMELTVFTYDDEKDFDPETGLYIGNSSYTIKIYRKK